MSRMSLLAGRSSRSAWNARSAVVHCYGTNVFLTPSHVKASLTAAMVVRSLWAELGEVWFAGVLLGWVMARRELFWTVSGDVVVAVDMWVPENRIKSSPLQVGGGVTCPHE